MESMEDAFRRTEGWVGVVEVEEGWWSGRYAEEEKFDVDDPVARARPRDEACGGREVYSFSRLFLDLLTEREDALEVWVGC